jgi:hypothetical protein
MDRQQAIQTLMKKKKLNNYLEIGVFNGHIFFRVKSNFKVAVDPEFRFHPLRKFGKSLLNPHNFRNKYFEKTSDAFFQEDAPSLLNNKQFDIALIDGMHEYEYALRDVENTLQYLSPNGIIVMHDCNPKTKLASCSFNDWKQRQFADTWNGDVWKVMLHMQSQRNDVNAFVLDCDHGLGIISWGKPEKKMNYTKEQIIALTYEDFNKNRKDFINLKSPSYLNEYFGIK